MACPVNNRVILSVSCWILLFLLLSVPALAATVACPSSCSCLLPAEAKKLGSANYCGGKQNICAIPSVDPATGAAYEHDRPAGHHRLKHKYSTHFTSPITFPADQSP